MESYKIRTVLMNALPLQEVEVTKNGSYFQVIAIGKIFNGMTRVKKQQTIYAPLAKYIANDLIHALSIQAYTPQEWRKITEANKPNKPS